MKGKGRGDKREEDDAMPSGRRKMDAPPVAFLPSGLGIWWCSVDVVFEIRNGFGSESNV